MDADRWGSTRKLLTFLWVAINGYHILIIMMMTMLSCQKKKVSFCSHAKSGISLKLHFSRCRINYVHGEADKEVSCHKKQLRKGGKHQPWKYRGSKRDGKAHWQILTPFFSSGNETVIHLVIHKDSLVCWTAHTPNCWSKANGSGLAYRVKHMPIFADFDPDEPSKTLQMDLYNCGSSSYIWKD